MAKTKEEILGDEFSYVSLEARNKIMDCMEEYASQFRSGEGGLRWVKAKERLPKTKNAVLCNWMSIESCGQFDMCGWKTRQQIKDFLHHELDLQLEWLDYIEPSESPASPSSDGWIAVDEKLPEKEGRYLCLRVYDTGGENQFVSNFKFSTDRESGKRVIDEDGITGGFQNNNAYGQIVNYWQTLPPPPKVKQ